MFDRYKVLGTMLNLATFTVDQVAEFSGVDEHYVSLVVAQEKKILSRRNNVYSLIPASIAELETRVRSLQRNLHLEPILFKAWAIENRHLSQQLTGSPRRSPFTTVAEAANEHKLLASILNLRQFTTGQLAEFSGLEEVSLQLWLRRERAHFELIDEDTFRLRAQSVESLRRRVCDLEANLLSLGRGARLPFGKPLSLAAADDLLMRRYPLEPCVHEKKKLLSLALVRLQAAALDLKTLNEFCPDQLSAEAWRRRLVVLDQIRRLYCRAEQAALPSSSLPPLRSSCMSAMAG